jgi:hypothetical protein
VGVGPTAFSLSAGYPGQIEFTFDEGKTYYKVLGPEGGGLRLPEDLLAQLQEAGFDLNGQQGNVRRLWTDFMAWLAPGNDPIRKPAYHTGCIVAGVSPIQAVLARWNQPDVLDDLLALTRGRPGVAGVEVPLGEDVLVGMVFIEPTPPGEKDDLPRGLRVRLKYERCPADQAEAPRTRNVAWVTTMTKAGFVSSLPANLHN